MIESTLPNEQVIQVRFLLLAFVVVPLVEMLLLFEVSDHIGGLSTVLLVVLTAVIGIQILKQQGFSTLLRANERLASGELPAQEIIEGMMLAAAGALLLTPGFITDTVGFIFLTGPLRRPLARRVIKAGIVSTVGVGRHSSHWHQREQRPGGGNIYEGEYSSSDRAELGRNDGESDDPER